MKKNSFFVRLCPGFYATLNIAYQTARAAARVHRTDFAARYRTAAGTVAIITVYA